MKTWNFLLAFGYLIFFVHCTATHSNRSKPTPTHPVGMKKKSVEKKAAIREIVQVGCTDQLTLTRGQILTLKLPVRAGTGYMWLLHKPTTYLKLNNPDELKLEKLEKTESGKVGFAQYQVLTLETLAAGTETLDLVYVRPTDQQNVGNSCSIQVSIQE
jgi:predicted secreted protein